ncbi:heat shock protein 21 [Penaeus vannamei]|uniref:Heat shock protein 21 n=1 Tax=Penaeus vannamei TaxID=6689 RepID=A0A3R7LTA8_PENVA|nr:heat shock protein 21 [Penaeus vannamei]
MAPVPHSYDLKVSAREASPCQCEEPSKRRWDVALPISRRGSFFQDSFFSDVHDEFDATVRRVLARWRDTDFSLRDCWDDNCRYSDILKRYRQLRSLNLKEEDQAVTVTSDTSGHKEDQSHQKTTVVPIKLEEAESSSASKTSDKNEASSVENTSEESNCSRKPICETIKKESINIPSRAKEVPTVNSVQPRSVEIDISKECINDDVCGVEKQGNVKTTERTNPDITDESNLVCKELDSTGLEISRQRFWDEFLPITRRGSFFQDSFFSDMHTKFDAAIRKVLNRWSSNELEWTDTWDDVGFHYKDILERYRELRSRHLEENLAVTVTSDKTGHKKCQRKEAVVPVQLESKEEEAVRAGHGGSPADVLVSPDEAEKKGSSADLLSPTSDDDDEEGYTFIVRRPGNSYGVSFGDDEDSHAWKRESSAGDSRSKCALKSSGLDCESRNLAIVRKGLFADDCCFENVRRNYSQAVRQVLEKANEWSCGSDALDKYRKLRQQKIVMDVLDFLGGDVTVRLVEGKELLVEGQAERQDGGRVSRVSFVRRFALPELVERDAVSCVLSSDGILTIVSEKKGDALASATAGVPSRMESYPGMGRGGGLKGAGDFEDSGSQDSEPVPASSISCAISTSLHWFPESCNFYRP